MILNVELSGRTKAEEDTVQVLMMRKLSLFGHICRMEDRRLIKTAVFQIIEGKAYEEDQTENGWMISKSDVDRRTSKILSTELMMDVLGRHSLTAR